MSEASRKCNSAGAVGPWFLVYRRNLYVTHWTLRFVHYSLTMYVCYCTCVISCVFFLLAFWPPLGSPFRALWRVVAHSSTYVYM